MKLIRIVAVIALVLALLYVFVFRNLGQEPSVQIEEQAGSEVEIFEEVSHDHNGEDQEVKPFYQGEIITLAHGGGYTFLEILESTDMSFWIVVDKVDAKKGDFVMFQEDLVAHNFHSKALDRTFEEIMFATNLQYRVSE